KRRVRLPGPGARPALYRPGWPWSRCSTSCRVLRAVHPGSGRMTAIRYPLPATRCRAGMQAASTTNKYVRYRLKIDSNAVVDCQEIPTMRPGQTRQEGGPWRPRGLIDGGKPVLYRELDQAGDIGHAEFLHDAAAVG